MEFQRIIFISFLFLLLGVDSSDFPMNDLITKLLGQPNVNFRQFAGYIDVDENVASQSLFYYFVEAEKDLMTQPLTIWLTGGPGCSSVGDGFRSVGPFIFTKDAHALQTNFFSWNKDDSTNNILLIFMQKWYEKYPVFKSKDLYLAGSSFAGHFVPNLANALLDDNKQFEQSKFNLKGLVLGNPMLLQKCKNLTFEANLTAFKTDAHNYSPQKLFDVFRAPCAENEQDLNLGKWVPKVSSEVDMCIPLRVQFYFNLSEVQKAFHGNRTNFIILNSTSFKYNEADKDLDMLLALQNLLQQSIPITIFSGDQDGIIPTMGTLQHLEKLAEELNIKLTKEETWSFNNKERGLKYEFGDLLKFLTVKGGNHHVTSSRPSQAFSIFKIFAINWMH
ncbi:hypothetical protein ES332_A07G143400v1 [Gossypium tomentosum]|uniref:Serine carboxypeptidase-like 44 n=1 Tax=Gossypium tomentosum TaxID=34277 RepID=A0A5D2PSS8_GOSTO|nr:hypothetical protein ES332_A07G143400v1 [Gossypium tomentosum]